MHDFLRRRQEARCRAAAFWQGWQWELLWQTKIGGTALVNSGNCLLHRYFPDVVLQEVPADGDTGCFQVAFSSGGKIMPMADAVLLAEAAPPDLPFGVQALLRRIPAAELMRRQSAFGSAVLTGKQLQVACRAGCSGLVRLQVFVNDDTVGMDGHDRRLAVWLLLAQSLGQWDLNVKTDTIELVEQVPPDAVNLAELPLRFDRLWCGEMGHNGVYPAAEPMFRLYRSDYAEGGALRVLVRNESAATLLGRADLAWRVSIRCEAYDEMSLAWAEEMGGEFAAQMSLDRQGILTTLFTDCLEGEYTASAMVADPEALLAAAQEIASRYGRLDARVDCVFDPSWRHYRL